MPPAVRPATESDVPFLVEFNLRLAGETESKDLDRAVLERGVRRLLGDAARGFYLVAEDGERVAGQVLVTYEWSDWRDAWMWWLQSVYVRKDARGRGVFRALVGAVRERARHQGDVVGLRLYVERLNEGARLTYERMGFQGGEYLMMQEYPLGPAT